MLNIEWLNNIDIDEISNKDKRSRFSNKDENWLRIETFFVGDTYQEIFQIHQLRGTKLIKIVMRRKYPVYNRYLHTLGVVEIDNNEWVGTHDYYIPDYLLKRVKELRSQK